MVRICRASNGVGPNADAVDRTVHAQETRAVHDRHVTGRLRGVGADVVASTVCMYTVTPDAQFIVDAHPAMDRVTVVSACSGHGFKHSAGIGEAVAERVLIGRSTLDLSAFLLARFG